MEWPRWEQVESLWPRLWPKKVSSEELQEELRKMAVGNKEVGRDDKRKDKERK